MRNGRNDFPARFDMNAITGLIIRNKVVAWTTLSEDKSGLAQRTSRIVLLDIDDAACSDPEAVAAAMRRQCPELSGAVAAGVSSEQVLMRVIDLPTVDESEIPGMVQLQVDKLSPFSGDKMASSFEVLRVETSSCRVLVATVRRTVIDLLGDICRRAGLNVIRIDLEAMAWWKLLCDQQAILSAGRQIAIILEESGGLIIAAQQGIPAAFKPISPANGLSENEYATEIASETGSLLLALDLEHGEAPVSRMDLWHGEKDAGQIVARLREEFGETVRPCSLSSLPPLSEGVALRAQTSRFPGKGSTPGIRGVDSVMDLVPESWRKTAALSQLRRRAITAFAVIFAVWFIGMALLGVMYRARRGSVEELEARMAMLQKPADEARALQKRVDSFEQYLDKKRSALECLLEIDLMRPSELKLTSFQFKKGKNVLIRGEAREAETIIDFKQRLDTSSLFEAVEMGAIQPKKRKDQTVQTFNMNIKIPEQTK